MANKLDLNKIRDEIDKEKKSRTLVPSQLGENVSGGSPRDVFLHGLLQARESGADTVSTQLIKVVENKTSEKHGGVAVHKINETVPAPTQRTPTVDMSPERDEQLFADLEKKKKQTLAESISAFQSGVSTTPTSSSVNYNGQQFLTSMPTNMQNNGTSMQINEAALVENVKSVVNGYLTENLGAVFEEAIKGTIIEMYAVERIKEVLSENRDLIKSVVVETIKEIRAKSQTKAG